MIFASTAIKSLLQFLPEFSVTIPFGKMKGAQWIAKSANPGQIVGRYEPEQEVEFLKLLNDVETLWDVGAHVGWYSILAAKQLEPSASIYSFEPNPHNLHFLKQHKDLNSFQNIKIIEHALSDYDGEAFFTDNQQQSSLNKSGDFKVSVTTGDQIAQSHGESPDLIKVDVEGAEIEFLNGAKKLITSARPKILLSAHGYKKNDGCLKWFKEHQYTTEHLLQDSDRGDYVIFAKPNN